MLKINALHGERRGLSASADAKPDLAKGPHIGGDLEVMIFSPFLLKNRAPSHLLYIRALPSYLLSLGATRLYIKATRGTTTFVMC